MIIRSSEFICAAVKPSQYPPEGPAEIAFTGRSNVGKSSLINLILNRRKLAKVSSKPGKTRTINFYSINDGEFRLDWGKMMESYLSGREGLKCVVQLVDSRHEPTAQDRQMYEYLRYYGLDGIVAATKADKLSGGELARNLAAIRRSLDLGPDDALIPVSALKRTGTEQLLEKIREALE